MLRFCDPGGRMYTSAGTSAVNLLAWWTSVGATTVWSVSAGNGRTTGSSLRGAMSSGTNGSLRKTLTAQATWGLAFGFRTSALGTTNAIAAVEDSGTTQVDLRVNSDGTLALTRNGTILATSTNAISINAYYHIEFKITIHNTAGNYELRVNGTSTGWIPAQGGTANTRASANNSANAVRLGPSVNSALGATYDYDDLVVYDDQATDTNGFADIHDFIGDCGVAWLLPTGAGTTTQFTPLASTNFSQVNEATPDGDTSYVESATIGQVDTYATADLPAGVVTVKSLAVANYAKKTDVGSRGMKAEVRSGGGNTVHATETSLTNGYLYTLSVFGQDPNNGSAIDWTPTSVNALEIGQTVSS